jgi:O-methyltransferase
VIVSAQAGRAGQPDPRDLYLELLKRALSYSLWDEPGLPLERLGYGGPLLRGAVHAVAAALRTAGLQLVRVADPARRAEGAIWPGQAHTMIGLARLDNLRHCVETVLVDGVPGDLIETGVWRGGASIFMRGILAAWGDAARRVFVADSFRGLPKPDPAIRADRADRHHRIGVLAVSRDEVAANFARYGLLDERVVFLEGWFKDTLAAAPIERLAVLRLDGDMYESTLDALAPLYPKLSPGGFCIIDDYALPGCRQAVDEYRAAQAISAPLERIDWTGVFWRKES